MALFEKIKAESVYSGDGSDPRDIFLDKTIERYRKNISDNLIKIREYERMNGTIFAIVLTDTSAVPFGWALKEGYKIVNPGRKIPKFLRINVKSIRDFISSDFNEGETEMEKDLQSQLMWRKELKIRFDKLVEKWRQKIGILGLRGKNIAIFDEASRVRKTLTAAKEVLGQAGAGSIMILTGGCENNYPIWKIHDGFGYVDDIDNYNPLKEDTLTKEVGITDRKNFPNAKLLIHDMKELGRQAGEKALKEIQNCSTEASLEKNKKIE